jgi:hypothetical protein
MRNFTRYVVVSFDSAIPKLSLRVGAVNGGSCKPNQCYAIDIVHDRGYDQVHT